MRRSLLASAGRRSSTTTPHLMHIATVVAMTQVACFQPTSPVGTEDESSSSGTGSSGPTTSMTGPTTTVGTEDTTDTAPTTTSMETTADSSGTTTTDATDPDGSSTTEAGPACGNDQPDEGEACDDGNTRSGDGCSAACQDETVFCDPRVVTSLLDPSDPFELVAAAGDRVIVAEGFDSPQVTVYDLADPDEPLFVGGVNLGPSVQLVDLIARADRAFAFGDPLVTSFEIDAQGGLSVADSVDGSSNIPFQGALGGSHLFIADDNVSRVVAATMLNNIALTGASLNLAGVMFPSYDGVAAGNGMAYVSVNGLLGIFDVTDPVNPVLQSTSSAVSNLELDEAGTGVFYIGAGLSRVDVSDPVNPVPAGTGALPANIAGRDHELHGAFAYVSTSNGNVLTYDASDEAEIVLVHELDVGAGAASQIAAGSEYVFTLIEGTLFIIADLPGYCTAVCGNGVVEYPEACDDGDLDDGNGCANDCA